MSRHELDYSHYQTLSQFLRSERPTFLINAAGYYGKCNVDAYEVARADTLQGNVLLPLMVSRACGEVWIS